MFAPAFAPFGNPEAIVNSKLALAFRDSGWDIAAVTRRISGISNYDYGTQWEKPWLSLNKVTYEIDYDVGSSAFRFIDVAAAALRLGHPIAGCRWAYRAYELASQLHKKEPFDIILSRAAPDVAHLPALAFARKTGLPWIANWNDPGGVKMPPPYGSGPYAPLSFFDKRFLREVSNNASLHTFPCQRLRDYMSTYLGHGTISKSFIIPHVALEAAQIQSSTPNVFSICYAGNLQLQRPPDIFFSALRRFVADNNVDKSIRVEFIGIESVGLNALAEHYGIKKYLTFLGPMSYTATLSKLAESTVNLVIEAPCAEGVFLPSKIVDYAQVGRPILAVSPRVGTVSDLLEKLGGGLAADCTSATSIYAALCQLFNSWRDNTLDERYGTEHLLSHFSPQRIIDSYKNIFEHALHNMRNA